MNYFHDFFFRDIHVSILKMIYNVQKSGLENMSRRMCVQICAKFRKNKTVISQERTDQSN